MTTPVTTLSCERFIALVDAYLDGELSRAGEVAARAHVRECAGCAREMERAVAARGILRSMDAMRPSAALRAAVAAGVRAEQARRLWRSRWLRVLVPALGPAVVAAAAFALWSQTPQPRTATPPPRVATSVAPDTAVGHPGPGEPSVEVVTAPDGPTVAGASATPSPRPDSPHATMATRPAARPRDSGPSAVVAEVSGPRGGAPSYLTGRLETRSRTTSPMPVVTVQVPEPEAVFVASAEARYSL